MLKGKGFWAVLCLSVLLVLGIVGCDTVEDITGTDDPVAEEQGFVQIVGIDPGSGIMLSTEEAIATYGLNLDVIEGSDAAMTAELASAIENNEWIVVTGWAPHWKFAEWDLKFLDDPEGVYGGEEYIATIARQGFDTDMPEVYAFLQNFKWGDDEIGAVMAGNAQTWIEVNRDKVDGWLPENFGAEAAGQEVRISMVEWDCAIASTSVVTAILEEAGYSVDVTSVDAGVMWAGTAAGDFDFFTTAWLPGTHETYFADYGAQLIEVGVSYEGARIGLVVPDYVTINSIAEINDHIIQ